MREIKTILISLLLLACTKSPVSYEEYMEIISSEESGLRHHKEIRGITVEVQYLPSALLEKNGAAQGLQENIQHYRIELESDEGTIEALIASGGSSDPLMYLSYGLEKDVYIEVDNKRQAPVFYHFERTNGLKRSKTILVAFEAPTQNDFKLVLDAPPLNTGPLKFRFNKENFTNLPKLKNT